MKLKTLDELSLLIEKEKKAGKIVVHCHGCFDLLHYGHLIHFKDAKAQGDILIVTVTQDHYVNKGKGRPFFNEKQRAEFAASLEVVDYVAINQWRTAAPTIRKLAPNLYVKGKEYATMRDEEKMKEELDALEEVGGKIYYSEGLVFSSTFLINNGLLPSLLEAEKDTMKKDKAHVLSTNH